MFCSHEMEHKHGTFAWSFFFGFCATYQPGVRLICLGILDNAEAAFITKGTSGNVGVVSRKHALCLPKL